MTEEQIDARVERMLDHLETLLLAGEMSPKDFASNVIDLHRWAESKRPMSYPHPMDDKTGFEATAEEMGLPAETPTNELHMPAVLTFLRQPAADAPATVALCLFISMIAILAIAFGG